MKSVAIVTGASGYLGRALSSELVAREWDVRCCSRSASHGSDNHQSTDGLSWFRDDPENQITDASLFENVDTVFHLAGLAHQHHSITADAYARANVQYTRSVATRAAQAGVRHFVFMSSVAAVADRTTDSPITPESEPAPRTEYGKSKWVAEQVAREVLDPALTTWSIIRPPLIYGVNPKGNLKPLLRLSRSGLPLPFGGIDNKRSMVSRKNLTDLLILCAHPDFSGKNRVLMPADTCLSTPALVSAVRAANGDSPRLFTLHDSIYNWLEKLPGLERRAQVLRSSLQIDDPWLHNTMKWRPRFSAQEQINAMATCP
jgi:nucleoside-diphosphate-sugar epimerase